MRVFVSYHTSDRLQADRLQAAILAAQPSIDVFLDHTHLRHGHFWQPSLFDGIARADAFLILVGNKVGDWQKAEYYAAQDKKINNPDGFILLPVIIADSARGPVANLPGLSQLHWIEATDPTAPEPLSKLLRALDGQLDARPIERWRLLNPYRGLSALEEQDADFFFGRHSKTQEVLHAVANANTSLITLIGNSGVGKTSLVKAGVIASLQRERWPGNLAHWPERLKSSRSWTYLSIRPNDNPIRALVSAFTSLWFDDPTDPNRFSRLDAWEARLKASGRLSELLDATEGYLRELGQTVPLVVFLYIDQGEELYSRNDRNAVRQFSELLARGISDARVIIMTSLRSDFYGYLQANEFLFSLAERIDVPPLLADDLKSILREPTTLLGVTFESDAVVDLLVKETEDQPGALPLLADFMTELWQRMQGRGDGVLRILERGEALQIGGSLARRADLFVEEHANETNAVRRLFTKLAVIHEGSAPARRRVLLDSCTSSELRLIQELAAARWRLVVTGQDDQLGRYAEVAHEVLLREWATLRSWLEDQRSFLLWKTDVEKLYARWQRAPRHQKREGLLSGLTLKDALRWNRVQGTDVDIHLKRFIIRSAEVRYFGYWNAFILIVGIFGFIPFVWLADYVATKMGIATPSSSTGEVIFAGILLYLSAGVAMRLLLGLIFRSTVGAVQSAFFRLRPNSIARDKLMMEIEAVNRDPASSISISGHEELPLSAGGETSTWNLGGISRLALIPPFVVLTIMFIFGLNVQSRSPEGQVAAIGAASVLSIFFGFLLSGWFWSEARARASMSWAVLSATCYMLALMCCALIGFGALMGTQPRLGILGFVLFIFILYTPFCALLWRSLSRARREASAYVR